MAKLINYATFTTILCFVHAQGGYYNPYELPARPSYQNGFNQPNVAIQVYTPQRRSDTCAAVPGSTCMFVLLCMMAGGVSAGSCSNSLMSTCCLLPNTQPQQTTRVWPSSVSNNIMQTAETGKPYGLQTTPRPRRTQRNFTSCGIPQAKPQSRIIGGTDAMYGEFPWQAHIKINKQQCGGVVLNRYYVLTAAHCIYQIRLSDITVQLGVYDIQDNTRQQYPPQTFSVIEKKIHPSFKYQAAHPDQYDVALLKLDKPVRFQENIIPICLPQENASFQGWKAIITGWGKTDTGLGNRFGTRILQKVDVPIISNQRCEKWHHEKGIDITISQDMVCAGYEEGQKDACVGDSGGPLMVVIQGRWTVVGLVSAGFGCAQSKQPGIYHRIPHTVEWVKDNIVS